MTHVQPASIGFTTNTLDRLSEERTEETLRHALSDDRARFVLRSPSGFLCDTAGEQPDPIFQREDAETFGDWDESAILLLGYEADGRPVLALPAPSNEDDLPPTIKQIDLRSLAAQGVLPSELEGRLAQAQHLLLWHGENRFCATCSGPMEKIGAGASRRCTVCGKAIFPRINPVSIMLIHDGNGRCVLGRQPNFPENSWSCLAGFVEAGETLEAAVRRETREEAGIEVGEVFYRFSQPWPFSGNLMLGFMARALTTDIRFDSNELEACRWFARDEVAAMLERRHAEGLIVPPPLAIAHHLIRAFVEEPPSPA